MTLEKLPSVAELVRLHDLSARKSLGQNFLFDERLIAKIAIATGKLDGVNIVEVGPGPGGLTRALLAAGATRVVAIERDPRCLAALESLVAVADGKLSLFEADALLIDPVELVPAPRRLIANLPYNVATPLLIGWLKRITEWQAMALMFQKEVAERITAAPGSKSFGRLAVIVQWLAHAEAAFDISPGAFRPSPKVTSTVIVLHPRERPLAPCDFATLERVTAAAFGQRRKMLRASLRTLGTDGEALCIAAGVEPTARAEQLTVEEFCALARAVAGNFTGETAKTPVAR